MPKHIILAIKKSLLVCLFLLVSCSEAPIFPAPEPTTPPTPTIRSGFDRRAMLASLVNEVILPAHNNFALVVADLEAATAAFVADPNEETLTAVQEAWVATSLARMTLFSFRLGVVDQSLLHNRLERRPARIKFIDEDVLAGEQEITNEYLASIGSSSVGLGAMEYLLFNAEGGNTAVLATFSDTTGPRRLELVHRLSQNVHQRGRELAQLWATDGDDYATAFINADMDGGDLQSSLNMFVNQIISDVEEIVITRLGKPAGQRANGGVRPDLAEAPYSQTSLQRIITTVEGQHLAFNGGDGLGIDDYLDFVAAQHNGQPLSEAINDQFATTLAALEAIEGPLETAVENDLPQVETAIDETLSLLVLLNVDVTANLGIILTFNDNDGD